MPETNPTDAVDPTNQTDADATDPTDADASEPDDMRKRFAEALERKKQASHGSAAGGAGGDGGKGHGGSGPAKAQRTFRRKSG